MTEQTETRIPYGDLTRLSLPCRVCGTEVIFDISREDQLHADWPNKALRCSFCTHEFDSQVKQALDRYVRWFERIQESGQALFFVVKKS